MAMQKRFLTDDEQRALLSVAKGSSDPLAQRDWAWMRLLIETGMRINELATMRKSQAVKALASGWLVVDKGQRKGGKKGHAYVVTAPVRECLGRLVNMPWPAWADHQAEAPLVWGSGRSGRAGGWQGLSVRSYQARLSEWALSAGLAGGISPHWLRHTRGVNVIRRSRGNNPLKVAQEALGHVSIASTGIYTQLLRDDYVAEMHHVAGGRLPKRQAMAAAERQGARA